MLEKFIKISNKGCGKHNMLCVNIVEKIMNTEKVKLAVIHLGLAFGILWGLGILITGVVSTWHGVWGMDFVTAMGSVYVGYTNTYLGSIIGGLWGFVDGFITGIILAWLYNCLTCCFCRKCHK